MLAPPVAPTTDTDTVTRLERKDEPDGLASLAPEKVYPGEDTKEASG